MRNIFRKDVTLKLVSILSATLFWFVVMDNANPISTIELSVPLKIQNESLIVQKGLSIKNKNYPKNVSVSIKGRKDKISTINVNDVDAILDLSKINDVNSKTLYVEVYLNKEGSTFEGVTPRAINFDIEKIGENNFPIEVVKNGKLKDNYKIVRISTFPEIISVQNTDSIIKSIGSVKVFVDVNNADKDFETKKICKIYSKNGIEIIDLNKSITTSVKVEIAKEIDILPITKGKPAKNFIDGIRNVIPEKALVTGASDILDKVSELRTEPIDIENVNQNINRAASLVLPEGIKLIDTPSSVSVNIAISQLAKVEFTYTKSDIIMQNTDSSLKYTFLTPNIVVEVNGNKEELEKIDHNSLKPSIDVLNLGEGKHKVLLKFLLPSTVKLARDYVTEIMVEKPQ